MAKDSVVDANAKITILNSSDFSSHYDDRVPESIIEMRINRLYLKINGFCGADFKRVFLGNP